MKIKEIINWIKQNKEKLKKGKYDGRNGFFLTMINKNSMTFHSDKYISMVIINELIIEKWPDVHHGIHLIGERKLRSIFIPEKYFNEELKMEEINQKILVLDLETTGFLDKGGHIVEIGMVLLDVKTGKITGLFDEVICPDQFKDVKNYAKIYKASKGWIFDNSTLTMEEVLEAKTLSYYRKNIQFYLDQYPVTAFNKEFDIGFLKSFEFKVPNELSCIMKILTPYTKLPGSYNGYKWPKVEEAWEFLFPAWNYVELHRGYDDTFHEAKILWEMIKRGYYKIDLK